MILHQVTKVAPTAVNTRIMCVGSHALDVDFTGTIRLADVRQTEVDKVGNKKPNGVGGIQYILQCRIKRRQDNSSAFAVES